MLKTLVLTLYLKYRFKGLPPPPHFFHKSIIPNEFRTDYVQEYQFKGFRFGASGMNELTDVKPTKRQPVAILDSGAWFAWAKFDHALF